MNIPWLASLWNTLFPAPVPPAQNALEPVSRTLIHSAKCPWVVQDDGVDLVVRNVTATCFGGGYDKGDNGQTESGVMNDGRDPHLMGVALPIRSTESATKGSPLAFPGPHIPWLTPVMVWREDDGEDTAVQCKLIDNGPNVLAYPTHALDVTVAVALHFTPGMDRKKAANEWGMAGMSYRIIGGAKYAQAA